MNEALSPSPSRNSGQASTLMLAETLSSSPIPLEADRIANKTDNVINFVTDAAAKKDSHSE